MANVALQDPKMLVSAQIANTGGADNIFLVSGLILLKYLFSTIQVASGANLCSWQYDPTTGTANQVLCADGDINAGLVGDVVTITETAGVRTLTTGAVVGMVTPVQYILPAGTLTFVSAAADGELIHYIAYVPLSAGAVVTLAP